MSVSIRENGECTAMAGYTIPERVHASETPAVLTKDTFLHTLDGKEERSMSFAGVTFVKGKVLAFSDSKSTRIKDGKRIEAGSVQKVFKNDDLVLTCTGINTLPVLKDQKYYVLPLAEWINGNIQNTASALDICKRLFDYIRTECVQCIDPIIMIGAYRLDDNRESCMFFLSEISQNSFSFKEQLISEANSWYSGDDEYLQYFNHHPEKLFTTSDVILENEIKKSIREIENGHDQNWYNPVGGKIQVEIL